MIPANDRRALARRAAVSALFRVSFLVLGRRPHESMGRQLDRQGLERGQHLAPDVLAGEHVVAAASANEVDQRDKVRL
jgi:hypothetical protein